MPHKPTSRLFSFLAIAAFSTFLNLKPNFSYLFRLKKLNGEVVSLLARGSWVRSSFSGRSWSSREQISTKIRFYVFDKEAHHRFENYLVLLLVGFLAFKLNF